MKLSSVSENIPLFQRLAARCAVPSGRDVNLVGITSIQWVTFGMEAIFTGEIQLTRHRRIFN